MKEDEKQRAQRQEMFGQLVPPTCDEGEGLVAKKKRGPSLKEKRTLSRAEELLAHYTKKGNREGIILYQLGVVHRGTIPAKLLASGGARMMSFIKKEARDGNIACDQSGVNIVVQLRSADSEK